MWMLTAGSTNLQLITEFMTLFSIETWRKNLFLAITIEYVLFNFLLAHFYSA